jgi:hypothetical protein
VNDPARTAQKHPHPMPGWIAVVPIPEPEDEKHPETGEPCPDCGQVHAKHPLAVFLGINAEPPKLVKGLVVEMGSGFENAMPPVPFDVGAVVRFQQGQGVPIEDALFMAANAVIAWDD